MKVYSTTGGGSQDTKDSKSDSVIDADFSETK